MKELEAELGKVREVDLFLEDHGLLTFYVHLEFGGCGQGFGGYALDAYDKAKGRRVGHAAGTDMILRLLKLFGVDRLESAKGKPVYALREKPYGPIVGLRTPSFDDNRTLLVSDWVAEWFPEEAAKQKAVS